MTAPSIRLLANAVVAALDATTLPRVYLVEIGKDEAASEVKRRPPLEIPNSQGRVQPYGIVIPTAGNAPQLTLGGPFDGLVWPFKVKIAAGYAADCGEAIKTARDALTGASLTVVGARLGICLEDEFTTTEMQEDRDVKPVRHWQDIFYRLHADGG